MRDLAPLHVGISVESMESALDWYKKNLDFEIVSDEYMEFLHARVVFIRNGEFEIELFEYDEPHPLPEERKTPNEDLQTVGTKHVALYTKDLASLMARFKENGVDVVMERVMNGNPMCFIRDNSGVLIEIIEKYDF